MKAALTYLRSLEFREGNGQCGECWGVSEAWAGDFRYPRIENTGHKKDCKLAKAIRNVGGQVRYARKVDRKESNDILRREEPELFDSAVRSVEEMKQAFIDGWTGSNQP